MELIKEITIHAPPTKYVQKLKRPKFDSKGKLVTENVHYLTSNLFFNNNLSYFITNKIIDWCKDFLYPYFKGLPALEKANLVIEYYKPTDIDLDNVCFFYHKLIMDILKTPTPKQLISASKKSKNIITTNTIKDDDTKVSNVIHWEFFYGEPKMVVKIYGRVKDEQVKMEFFFK